MRDSLQAFRVSKIPLDNFLIGLYNRNMEPTDETISAVMAALGRRMTDKKRAACQRNAQRFRDPDVREKMRQAQQRRRERERQNKTSENLSPSP